jgi:hypothetical protein
VITGELKRIPFARYVVGLSLLIAGRSGDPWRRVPGAASDDLHASAAARRLYAFELMRCDLVTFCRYRGGA